MFLEGEIVNCADFFIWVDVFLFDGAEWTAYDFCTAIQYVHAHNHVLA